MSAFTSLRVLALSGLVGIFAFAAAQAASPTTPEQRTEMIGLVEKLETAPYSADGPAAREKVYTWLVDAPDVSVTVCGPAVVWTRVCQSASSARRSTP